MFSETTPINGICGWLQQRAHDSLDHSHDTLRAMATALGETSESLDGIQQGAHHTAALCHGGAGATARHGQLLVAYSGRPHWHDARLQALADEHGHDAAIAQAYRQHGRGLLQHIHGPFSLAVLDPSRRRALLAIDRMGIQPLCYWRGRGGVVFGANTRAVTVHPAVGRAIDRQSLFDYLYFHMVPSPRTIYQGVNKLLPGQYLSLDEDSVETGYYWRLEYQDHAATPFAELQQELQQLLRQALRRNLGGGTVGAFLSGGLDSSTTAGVLTEVLGQPAKTYSIGFDAEGYDETEFARATARHFGTDHQAYYVSPQDVVEAIPRIAAAYDEPFGNASAMPTYFCAKMARQDGIDIMIAGDGGDELFGGNARYAKQQVFEHYQRLPGWLRAGLVEPLALNLPGAGRMMPLRKLKSYVEQARVPLPDRLESYNFLHREPLGNIFTPDFLAAIDGEEPLQICRETYDRTCSHSILNKMMHLDLKNTLADNDLRKVNRMCQLGGVEVRFPLLDEALVEFSARVPVDLKLKGQELRWFYKQALKDYLAPETLNKSKHGFGLPFGLWMQEYAPLHDLAHDSLQAFRARGYVRDSYIEALQRHHNSEHAGYYGVMIWVIMMLEQWLQTHE